MRPTPIAETAIIGAAIGSSIAGMRPIAEIMFTDFLGVCLDQIANHAAKQRYMSGSTTHAPMVIRVQAGEELPADERPPKYAPECDIGERQRIRDNPALNLEDLLRGRDR